MQGIGPTTEHWGTPHCRYNRKRSYFYI